jgi:hypothetical protein
MSGGMSGGAEERARAERRQILCRAMRSGNTCYKLLWLIQRRDPLSGRWPATHNALNAIPGLADSRESDNVCEYSV